MSSRGSGEAPPPATILNVDDNDAGRYAKSRILRAAGYEVIEAGTGREALRLARESGPQLALIDVVLPDSDGFAVCQALKGDRATASIMVLLVSARRVQRENRVSALEKGADGYLVEPIEPEELLATIKALLRLSADITERKRAEELLQQSQRELQAELADTKLLQQLSKRLLEEDRPGLLYESILDAAVAIMHSDFASLQMLEPYEGKEHALRLLAFRGFTPEAARFWQWVWLNSECVCSIALKTRTRVIVPNVNTCASIGADHLATYRQTGIQAVQTTPLFALSGKLVGMVSTHWTVPHRPAERELQLLDILARQAADLMERKQAEEALLTLNNELERRVEERTREVRASKERLRALATELTLTEQRERHRLATELHDHLQQLLVLGKLKLGQGKRMPQTAPACVEVMGQVDNVLSEALQYTRSLVADLSPPVLRDHGLPAALQWLGENMKKHDLTVTINVSEVDDLKLPEDQAVLLFQSVRELLINASKHAGTGQATVTLERRNGCLGIHVRDEGNGFEPAASSVAERPNGTLSSKFGLFSIAERMKMLGGTCEIVSAPGQGTSATLMLPVGPKLESEVLSPGSPAVDLQASRHSVRSGLSAPGSRLPSNAPIRVLLVDDHAMMRQGLRTVLDGYADLKVVGEAEDGDEAITAVEQLQPDVVVMDLQMQKKNGIEATSAIKARHPDITIIGLSVNADAKNAECMRKAGAAMLLTKEAAVEQLYAAIQDAVYPSLLWKFSDEKIQA